MFRLSTAAASPSRLLLFGMVALLATACAFSALLLGYADLEFRRGDPTGLQRALRIAPLDAGYLAKWSLLTGNQKETVQALNRAVASNPWYAWAWIQLGLAAEDAGENSIAERDLLQAAAVDRGFDPRWALCNYYFRRGELGPFWQWTRAALSIEGAEALPVLRLAWKASPDVRSLLDLAVPRSEAARRGFLQFLIAEHPLGTDFVAVASLFATTTPDDIPMLDSYANTLLRGGETGHAVELWNSMCDRRLLPFNSIHAGSGNLLTNAAFNSAPSGRTFDWHFMPGEGIVTESHTPGAFGLVLSGNQPEHWRILSQQVPVEAGKRYAFKFQTHLTSGAPASGLRWKILEGTSREKALAESSGIEEGEVMFSPATSVVTVVFDYDRPRGETRLAGEVTVSGLTLTRLTPGTVDAR